MHLREVDANLLVTLDALLVDASVTRAAERLKLSRHALRYRMQRLNIVLPDESEEAGAAEPAGR